MLNVRLFSLQFKLEVDKYLEICLIVMYLVYCHVSCIILSILKIFSLSHQCLYSGGLLEVRGKVKVCGRSRVKAVMMMMMIATL